MHFPHATGDTTQRAVCSATFTACAAMTRPRSCLVSPHDTPWVHCVSRCVRRAFLCGLDLTSGKDFEHRRPWVVARIKELSQVFAIDIAAYAVMSNHYHLIVHLAPQRAAAWSNEEVLSRWTQLFVGPMLVRRFLSDQRALMDTAELVRVGEFAVTLHARLGDLSWFIRLLNESISRMANNEDKCSGRFWEGRFKSQALLDEQALLAALAYVDLNPVRAGMVATPEASVHTSIHERLAGLRESTPTSALMPFDATGQTPWAIPFGLEDYVALVDWTGRQHRSGKRGAINSQLPQLLERLGLDADAFLMISGQLLKAFGSAVGAPAAMAEHCARREMKYLRGVVTARRLFGGEAM